MRRIKETIDCYNGTRNVARYLAGWMLSRSDAECCAGRIDEGCWFYEKYNMICNIEKDYSHATLDLCRRFQRDLLRDVKCPPRS